MNEIIIRNPGDDEIPAIRAIWSSVFGDIGADAFYQLLYDTKMCCVAEYNGVLASMGYLIPTGEISPVMVSAGDNKPVKCAMIYAIATLPGYRGSGLATAIVEKLIDTARTLGYDAVVLCPSNDELFEYYSTRTGLQEWFYLNERVVKSSNIGKSQIPTVKMSLNDYMLMREKLLGKTTHIRQDIKILRYQACLCNESGGGFIRTGDSCAIIERQSDDVVCIKELLTPGVIKNDIEKDKIATKAIASIANMFPADEYLVRYPSMTGEGRRFGMLTMTGSLSVEPASKDMAPFYGVSFD